MKLIKIKSEDFNDLLDVFKQYINYDYFFTDSNQYFVDILSEYGSSFIFSKATHGFFLVDNRNNRIGTILFSIPNKPQLFENTCFDYDGVNLKNTLSRIKLNPIESQVLKLEIDVLKNKVFLFNKYKEFIANKAELLLFYINEKHRGKGLSNSLLSAFTSEILINGYHDYFLYTTSLHNFEFFDHLKLQRITKAIYTKQTCPNYLQSKIIVPYYGMIYIYYRKRILKALTSIKNKQK